MMSATMKKVLLTLFLLFLAVLDAAAEIPLVYPSQLGHNTFSFVRRTVCGVGAGGNCGSNPPTHHIVPEQCGTVFSTSIARNEDGSNSTEGVRFTLPTVDEMTAAGFTGGGGVIAGTTPTTARETQCFLSFVMALPGPSSWLRLGIEGVQGVDKVTFNYEGTFHDLFWGDVLLPFIGSSPIVIAWNGTSWLLVSGPPSILSYLGYGPMASQGQGRLFLVTADPSWWTVGSKIGSLAYCPLNGLGTTTPSNGGIALSMLQPNCVFVDSASGSLTYWVTLRNIGSFTYTGVAEGSTYPAGTAPNGTAYPAGSYIVLTGASASNLVSGNTVYVHNVRTTLGAKANGKWIVKVLTAPAIGCATGTCIELHEEVRSETDMNAASHIGPPSKFLTGDTLHTLMTPPLIGGSYQALSTVSTSGGAIARITNPASGSEEDTGVRNRSIVGLARTVSGAFADTTTNRYVASWFNPMEKKAQCVYTADRTTASATYVEPNTEIRCNFVVLNGVSATATGLGDTGRRVRYAPTITLSNDTAGGGCIASYAFDGVVNEPEVVQMVNQAGGADVNVPHTLTFSGTKSGLSEFTNHYGTLLVKTNGIGTCKVWKDYTFNTLFTWQ
jgi:hypothetical protein